MVTRWRQTVSSWIQMMLIWITDDVKMEANEKMGKIMQDATSEESMEKECYVKTGSGGDEINMHEWQTIFMVRFWGNYRPR